MKLSIENRFLFKIMQNQINNRLNFDHPYNNPYETMAELYWDSIIENGVMHIKDVKLPDIRWWDIEGIPSVLSDLIHHSWYSWPVVYADSIMIHHLFNGDYCEENSWLLEVWGLEGPYCFENVIVEKGDVVIDAGAYIGDWSAVATSMGGKVYAFEPNMKCINMLERCAEINNFKVEAVGLGDETCMKNFDADAFHGNPHFSDSPHSENKNLSSTSVPVTTLDKFTEEKNIHVDFLKSDIEGYERFMLKGARRVLTEDEPKLAIRTYHCHREDKEVLPRILHEINPRYKIYNRRNTMYAYV